MGRLRAELWRGKTERRGIVIGMEQSATQGLKEKKKAIGKTAGRKTSPTQSEPALKLYPSPLSSPLPASKDGLGALLEEVSIPDSAQQPISLSSAVWICQ